MNSKSRSRPAGSVLIATLAIASIGVVHGGLDNLLPVINKLQDVTAVMADRTSAIELPQIVVVGSQSSGKSSVLESIVGKDFLPRGSGIVTRAPLILQLQTFSSKGPRGTPPRDGCEEWGEFLHCPQKRFTDFNMIRKEIEDETGRITGGKKLAITHTPIRLRITSPRVPNLTLVDLPGLTKIAVGDQPQDIEMQIRDLVLKYTANPNSIILSVTPANSDMATSDAIQISKAVDPAGDRTIGVITKIDLMDRGTNAREMLYNKVVPLKLGYIGVVNRSQKDINDNKDVSAARQSEKKFFAEHPSYSQLAAAGKIGTEYLGKRLNWVLLRHIKTRLPALRARINQLVTQYRKELSSLGEAPSDEIDDQRKLLIGIITQYVDNFCTTIDGGRHLTSFSELRGGARISHTFNQLYPQHLGAISAHDSLKPSEIYTTIRNTKGARTSLYGSVPQDAFEMLVRRLVKQLREPSSWCVDTVFEELRIISEQCEPAELARFDALRAKFRDVVAEMLQRCFKDAKKMMENLISFELAYINTNHPDFVDVGSVLGSAFASQPPPMLDGGMMSPGLLNQPMPGTAEGVGIGGTGVAADSLGLGMGGVSGWFGGKEPKGSKGGMPGRAGSPPPMGPPPPPAPKQGKQGKQDRGGEGAEGGGGAGGRLLAERQQTRMWLHQGLEAEGLAVDPREEAEMELVVTLIVSYFDIVRKNLRDSVPKSTMHFMVNQAKDKIQVELLRSLYREDLMADVFNERSEVRQQREACRKMLAVLQKATTVLNEVHSTPDA